VIAIAIDGPAGAGKTTLARAVASRLGWRYLDTGAMYRAVALAALRAGIDPADPEVARVARRIEVTAGEGTVQIDGEDVTDGLRRPGVTAASAVVSRNPEVRREMVDRQRRDAGSGRVVMEGRDIGTVVLPDACLKIFLTANLEERAARRAREEHSAGEDPDRLKAALADRDESDSKRDVSPLAPAPGAVHIDSSDRTVEDIVEEVVGLVAARCGDGEEG